MGLRIIGGDLKRKKLIWLNKSSIRPTSDRLRESVFNILSFRTQERIVLDLFSGTGAFGFEALSRGAKSAVFIDNDTDALSLIKQNKRSLALDDRAKIIKWDIVKNLDCIKYVNPLFNLVFMDPPYYKKFIKPSLLNLRNSHCLEKEACVVVEHPFSESIPKDFSAYNIIDQRKYGKKIVSFLNFKE